MPTKNIVKRYNENQYYHVFNRSAVDTDMFREPEDYTYFLHLLARSLSKASMHDRYGRPVKKVHEKIKLVAYCLMPGHFHLLIHLTQTDGLKLLMQSTMTSYSMYFNKKYARTGGLFRNTFLASHVSQDYYLWHISRYIHLNPLSKGERFETYPYSSIHNYAGTRSDEWLHETLLIETAEDRTSYMDFVMDHETMQEDLKLLTRQLAGV